MPEARPKVAARDDLPILPFPDAAAWEAWLEEHHRDGPGVWLKIAKKATGIPTVTYGEAVDVALCFGWIDGQKGAFDETWFLQRFTPRRRRSVWSQVNVEKVATLTAAGRMRPAGLAQVEEARADGRWEAAYAGQATIEVPADFRAALDADPAATATWDGLTRGRRYAFLWRIHTAKRAETRERRIREFTALLARGETLG